MADAALEEATHKSSHDYAMKLEAKLQYAEKRLEEEHKEYNLVRAKLQEADEQREEALKQGGIARVHEADAKSLAEEAEARAEGLGRGQDAARELLHKAEARVRELEEDLVAERRKDGNHWPKRSVLWLMVDDATARISVLKGALEVAKEFASICSACPPGQLHLMPLAAQAALSEIIKVLRLKEERE